MDLSGDAGLALLIGPFWRQGGGEPPPDPGVDLVTLAYLLTTLHPGAPGAPGRMLGLGAIFTATTPVVFAGYGLGAAAVRRRVLGRLRVADWRRRCFAGSFLGLGLLLARAEA
ncbi:hypothetical protein SAMN05443287_12115 [Micromonospora phaseoli]|uniref:LysE type translocator n=1 Tax=Micromonospora phaseoli TaxID=1144548 RepID=A0A1H7E737_9ACTN|nr:hypothetical protein CLV64_11718 [Micromonospora phaseoli]SEK06425.1 hypothetical protein SAMN05443287_12115 [Micromonospora phaseoli]